MPAIGIDKYNLLKVVSRILIKLQAGYRRAVIGFTRITDIVLDIFCVATIYSKVAIILFNIHLFQSTYYENSCLCHESDN